MKHLKILALAAMACAALMAFASSASATTLKAGGTVVKTGTTISSSLVAKTSATLSDTSGFLQNTCTTSSVSGKTTNETGTTVTGEIDTLDFSTCNFPTRTIKGGKLHIAWTSGINGSVEGSGSEVETETPTGKCIYGTSTGTALGTLTGSSTANASMAINAVLPLLNTVSGTCAADARWKAEYVVTSPTKLEVVN